MRLERFSATREPLLCRTATRAFAVAVELAALKQQQAHW
jgi:hypothetical protein